MPAVLDYIFKRTPSAPPTPPKSPTPTTLDEYLAKLEIPSFDMKLVNKYKEVKMINVFNKLGEGMSLIPRPMPSDLSCLPPVTGKGWTGALFFRPQYPYKVWVLLKWQRSQVTSKTVMPEYVRNKAEQIQREIPGVIVELDELRTEQKAYDPFLVVKRKEGKEWVERHVEVWDEKEFERENG